MSKEIDENDQHWKVLVLLLKKIIDDKNISHEEIAEATGLHRSNVTRMFSLKYSPNLRTFILVARAAGVNFFFEDKEGNTDLTKAFESAMIELGRRPSSSPKN